MQEAKRNSLHDSDEAVSPVIAVILMVAITVVLAATVFLLVSEIPKHAQRSVPSFLFTQDEANDNIQIRTRSDGADWQAIEIGGSDKTFSFRFETTTTPVPLGDWVPVSSAKNPMEGGDIVKFCRPDGPSPLDLLMRDVQTSTVITGINFDEVQVAC